MQERPRHCSWCGPESLPRGADRVEQFECALGRQGIDLTDYKSYVSCRCGRVYTHECLGSIVKSINDSLKENPELALHDDERAWATLLAQPWLDDSYSYDAENIRFSPPSSSAPAQLHVSRAFGPTTTPRRPRDEARHASCRGPIRVRVR